HRVIKTRLTEEEYAEFSERVTLCKMSQAEFIRQALIKSGIQPIITVSPGNDELLSAVGKLTALNALAIDNPLEYARLVLDNEMQAWIDEEDSLEVW
ncbi:MAG: mobilization protein, partial [Lachnospiraceae bacterium]|nr:mobilization protein [Lachnospiraceae bacterium]